MDAQQQPNSRPQLGLALSLRPCYAYSWLARPIDALVPCRDDGFLSCHQHTGGSHAQQQCSAAVVNGCGEHAGEAAVVVRQALEDALHQHSAGGSSSQDQLQPLTPAALEAAFQACHEQLLQPQQQLDVAHSGASCLLLALDQQRDRLLVASAGLCRAVLARSSTQGSLTVLELSPRLALGHDAAETARLDAAGSSICYVGCSSPDMPGLEFEAPQQLQPGGGAAAAAAVQQSTFHHQQLPSCSPVLMAPDGQLLTGVGASRLLGYSAASAAGVLSSPVVTSWRLTGREAFVVLGSPGLWAAMNPAEVVDYVAAALTSGACSSCLQDSASTSPTTSKQQQQHANLLSDLLTLEAQERLKLQLSDTSPFAAAGSGAAAAGGVVPDVTAVVLLLQGAAPLREAAAANAGLLQEQLGQVSRGCRSNAEARVLQASWCSSPAAGSSSAGTTSMSSSASSSISSTATSILGSSRQDGSCHSCHSCPGLSPPAPALSCLLPALTVAGNCWPAAFWPRSRALQPVRVPSAAGMTRSASNASARAACSPPAVGSAGAASSGGGGFLTSSLEEAAAAAGILRSTSAAAGGVQRSVGFMLSPRLSCELDLTYDTRSSSFGSGSGLMAQCAAADAAAEAASLPSFAAAAEAAAPSAAEQQAVIVHKVRLSGPCELESLLYGNPTTAYPDTTVARILRPRQPGRTASSNGLVHASSWAVPGALHAPDSSRLRGPQHHAAPTRSATVSIADLARRRSISGDQPGSYSSASGHSHTSLKAAVAQSAAGIHSISGKENAAVSPTAASELWKQYSRDSERGLGVKARRFSGAAYSSAADPAGTAAAGDAAGVRAPKARSYQALSALHAASLGACSMPAASALEPQPAGSPSAAAGVVSSSADAAMLLLSGYQRSSGGGLAAALQPQGMHFRPAFAPAAGGSPAAGDLPRHGSSSSGWMLSAAAEASMEEDQLQQQHEQQQRQGSFTSAVLALAHAASLADSLASLGTSASETGADLPEGKVHGGLLRSRSSSMQAMFSAGAGAGDDEQPPCAAPSLAAAPTPADAQGDDGSAWTGSCEGKMRGGEAFSRRDSDAGNECMRGGHSKAARLKTSASSPALSALAMPAAASSSSSSKVVPINVRSCLQPGDAQPRRVKQQAKGVRFTTGSLPATLQQHHTLGGACGTLDRVAARDTAAAAAGTSDASCAGSYSAAEDADDITGRSVSMSSMLTSLAGRPAAAAAAAAGEGRQHGSSSTAPPAVRASSLGVAGRDASLELLCSEGDLAASRATAGGSGADGAVHGGELGERALEGQMHGGRRSKSMSLGSLILSPSLPSSAADDDDTLTSTCPSPGSHQHSGRLLRIAPTNGTLRAAHSFSSSISCASSSGGASRGVWGSVASQGSPLLNPPSVAIPGDAADAAVGGGGSLAAVAFGAGRTSGSGALSGSPFGAASSQQVLPTAASNGPLPAIAQTRSGNLADGASGGSEASCIEVLRMPSGSFTKVRLASSAPSAADTATCLAGEHGSSGSLAAAAAAADAAAAASSSNAAVLLETAGSGSGFRGWSSPGRQVKSFGSASAAEASRWPAFGADEHDPGNPLLPGAAPDWSSSRAWGAGNSGTMQRQLSGGGVARALAAAADSAFNGASKQAATGGGSRGSTGGVRSMTVGAMGAAMGAAAAAGGDGGTAAPTSTTLLPSGSAAGRAYIVTNAGSSSSSSASQDAAAATAAAAAALLGTSSGGGERFARQRSGPLPTLQESPAHTPGTSPDVAVSFMACLSDLSLQQQLAAQQQGLLQLGSSPGGGDSGDGGGQLPDLVVAAGQASRQRSAGVEGSRRSSSAGGDTASEGVSEGLSSVSDATFEFSRHPGHDWGESPLLGHVLSQE